MRREPDVHLTLTAADGLDTVSECMIVVDQDQIIRFANKAFYRSFCAVAKETEGRSLYDIVGSGFNTRSLRTLIGSRVFQDAENDPIEFEGDFPIIGRRNFRVHTQTFGESQEGPRETVVVLSDITEQRKISTALKEAEAHLRTILAAAPDSIITIDERGVIEFFSVAAERLFGYRSDEVIGKKINMLMPMPYQEKHDEYLNHRLLKGGEKVIRIGRVVHAQKKDGTTFPIELDIGEVESVEGRRRFTGFIRDITDRTLAERQMEKLQAQLRHVSRLCDMGEMASALAHELNQPLTAIMHSIGAGKRLMQRKQVRRRDVLECLSDASAEADRAGQVIGRLRKFVKLGETERSPEDINHVVEEATNFALTGATENEVKLNILGTELPPVIIDKVQIEQVLVNLLRNSLDAMSDSEMRELTVEASLKDDDTVAVTVSDTGTGVDEEVARKLFHPFVTTKSEGVGIGLSLSQSIIEAHGGDMEMRPNPNGGAIFQFTLPISTESI